MASYHGNIGMVASKHTLQQTNHGIIKQTCYCISLLREKDKQTSHIHVHHPNKIIFKSMHVHVNVLPHFPYCISTPMHQWTCECMIMASKQEIKETLRQHVKGKQVVKKRNRYSKTCKKVKTKAYYIKEKKRQKQET